MKHQIGKKNDAVNPKWIIGTRVITSVIMLLFLAMPISASDSFTFQDGGKSIEGYLVLPEGSPKALILYFHRGIEDRNAVIEWGKLLSPAGYAVAGYTATKTKDVLLQAQSALAELRKQKALAVIPCIAMGASMGTPVAAKLFASSTQIGGLILIVPGEVKICDDLRKADNRPILLIYAENDQIVDPSIPHKLVSCLPKANGQYDALKNQGHRFPPSLISTRILEWLQNAMKK